QPVVGQEEDGRHGTYRGAARRRDQPALVYCPVRYRLRSSSRIRNDLPIRTAGRPPVLISRYTVMLETRRLAATSVTVRNRALALSSIGVSLPPLGRLYATVVGGESENWKRSGTGTSATQLSRPLGRGGHRLDEGGAHRLELEGAEPCRGGAPGRCDRGPEHGGIVPRLDQEFRRAGERADHQV